MNCRGAIALAVLLWAGAWAPAAQVAPATFDSPGAAQGAAFLTTIRLADPNYHVILMACLKDHELNLLLSREVRAPEIPVLAKGLAAQLSTRLPGEDLSVVLFRPLVPLREAGVARLNGKTGEITYTSGVESNTRFAPKAQP